MDKYYGYKDGMKKLCKLYVLLFLSKECEQKIHEFFISNYNIKKRKLIKNLHLTLYHSKRHLINPPDFNQNVNIMCDTNETRFMTMSPGGENKRHDNLVHSKKTIGIRLTRRNEGIKDILELRRKVYKYEPKFTKRKQTTNWSNSFGSRHYQPHISILRPWNDLEDSLYDVGENFRSQISHINFSRMEIKVKY